ncbi:dynein axonemal assembly factor 8 isoform X2 [Melanerpes formicivorus]|uniref:dynein axonemal assembly factor 8 isoform X2 n=1 Tax=Melanerpes formicivorus TaxID=211600 RepID=UPI00358F1CF6
MAAKALSAPPAQPISHSAQAGAEPWPSHHSSASGRHLQGWALSHPPGSLGQVLRTLPGKEFLLMSNLNLPWGSLRPFSLVLWCVVVPDGACSAADPYSHSSLTASCEGSGGCGFLHVCIFSHLQLTQEAEGHPWEVWNGDLEGFCFQKHPEGAQVVAKEDTQMIQDSRDHLAEELGREQAMERGNSWLNTALSVEGLGSAKERRKLIKTKILSKIFLEPSPGHSELRVKPPSHDINSSAERAAEEKPSLEGCLQELPHLSLQKMEKWDQGKDPEELEQQRDNTQTEAALSSADHDTSWSKSENQLQEKLEELCARQSSRVSPHCSWPSAKLSSSPEQQENKAVAMLSSSPSSPRRARMSCQCLPEPGAVCTGLREAQAQKLAISDGYLSASNSSSEEEETMAVKDQAARRRRNCSGKSLLLQQLHAACREASELLPQPSTPAGKLEGSKQDPESLAKKDSPQLSQTQYFEETAEVIPRKLRLQREERTPPVFIHRARGADLGKGNQMAAEMAPN